jgi:hypothetical protein
VITTVVGGVGGSCAGVLTAAIVAAEYGEGGSVTTPCLVSCGTSVRAGGLGATVKAVVPSAKEKRSFGNSKLY